MEYRSDHLLESEAPADPYDLFGTWMQEAFAAKEAGTQAEPTAMVVATVHDGRPAARTVLLKDFDSRGFTFFTNYTSAKGIQLADSAYVACQFFWSGLHRQVRISGVAEQVDRAESEAYFATRPRDSQLGAWASKQSSVLSGISELEQAYRDAELRFGDGEIPCPPHWGGYRVVPDEIEFWQGQPSRLHDRLVYLQTGRGWTRLRLAP